MSSVARGGEEEGDGSSLTNGAPSGARENSGYSDGRGLSMIRRPSALEHVSESVSGGNSEAANGRRDRSGDVEGETGANAAVSDEKGWYLVDTTTGGAGGAPPCLLENNNPNNNPMDSTKGRVVRQLDCDADGTTRGRRPSPWLQECQRSLHSAAVLNGTMYVFGGYDGMSRLNDFHAFSFIEKRWSPVLPSASSGNPPRPRDRHVSVVHDNCFYVFGGFDGTSRVSDFFCFDFSSMVWKQIVPSTGYHLSPRHSHAACVYGDSMYVFGGYDGSYRSDFHEFDFNRSLWTPVEALGRCPRARYRATCVVHRDTMILFGGHDGTRHLNDSHVYNFTDRTWSSVITDGVPPVARDSHISVVHGNSMYVFGGSTGSAMNDLHELQLREPNVGKWRQIRTPSHASICHRFCGIGVTYEDALFVFGGYDGNSRLNDFLRFDFPSDDLACEIPESTLMTDLRSFVNAELLSDVTFIVEDQPIHAHKIMLMRCCYFRAMFMGDMMESHQSTIRLEDVRHSVFLCVLEYLYTDQLAIPLDSAMDLFVAADLFNIPRLQAMCEKEMLESMGVENAAAIFHAADLHSAGSLRGKALKFILTHFERVSKTAAFEEMARSNVELVFEILRMR